MIHGSLFSGIGGFDLAAQWMGWENAFHCEINPFCQTILKHYWPNAASYTDIKQADFSIHRGTVDIITGGFPCQPFSLAGKRKGTDDARYLWPEMLRAIREIQPQWVVGENVYGLVNWDGGLVFDTVCADLEAEGYEVQPVILPACSKDAPHKRERIWFIANAKEQRLQEWNAEQAQHRTHPAVKRHGSVPCWSNFPTQSPVRRRDDGFPSGLDGITFSKWRTESIKGFGNAIVPQMSLEIFRIVDLMSKAA